MKRIVLVWVMLSASSLFGQVVAPAYNPLETFAPLTLPEPVNVYRAANGSPGPMYWQNRADYQLAAKIDVAAKVLSADETITYTNNSPETLTALWIQMDQNIYREDARSRQAVGVYPGTPKGAHTQGFELEAVEVAGTKADYLVTDTRMQLRLAAPLHHGDAARIHIRYHFQIPGQWGGRMSWGNAKAGPIFDMAQWYPRMCVFDDLHGWDTQPYLANEFYLEYGDFDYSVTVPSGMVVAGSGELANPDQVLTPDQRKRLTEAKTSDKTVMIRSLADVADAGLGTDTKTWHFKMQNTRDVAFSASATFLWDAARMNLPNGRQTLAMSFYPAESAGQSAWGRSTEYLKDSVEHFSVRWFPYPYPVAINVAGPTDGMEYPGMLFDGLEDKGKELFWITAHEIGHTWFPMIVGFNERRNAWMDEGFNTFIDTFESDDFEAGVYGPKRDSEFAPGGGKPADEILETMKDPAAPVILTRADAIPEKYRHPVTYFKSALGLSLLREDILGPQRFDFAFRKFIADWAFKHPAPSDFFRAMESAGGEDLSYFWRGWYMHNWLLDMAPTAIKTTPEGSIVTIENRGQLIMPLTAELTLADGTKRRVTLPAETWIQQTSYSLEVDGRVKSVTLDPDHAVPLENRSAATLTP